MATLPLVLSLILFALGLLHFSWVLGSTLGFAESLPTKENGERLLNPKKIDSAPVGVGLTAFGLFYVFKSGLIAYDSPEWISEYGGWIIPIIFHVAGHGGF